MRGEIFSADHLESHAAALAAQQGGAKARRRGFPLLRRVRENGVALHTAHRAITRTSQSQRGLTPAAEWLADNFHVVDEQLREIRNHLPRDYYLELPKLAHGDFRDYPRVYAVICAYIAHTDSRLDAEILSRFVRAYQTVQPLTIGELWAVAITLRVALIENLRRLADLVVGGRDARIKADRVADFILGLRTPASTEEATPRDWERFRDSPYFDSFAVQIFQRIQDQTTPSSPALDWLDGELARRGLSSQEIIRLEHQKQAALNVSVRNIITSMRLVLELDWKEFFETASHVEAILRASPGYKDMDFDSRDLYRHAVEDLARGSGLSESEIAVRAVKAIEANEPGSTGEAGYHLIGPGRRAFQSRIKYSWRFRELTGMLIKRNALWAYPLWIAAFTALFAVQGAETLAQSGLGVAVVLILAVLAAVPLSEGAMALVNRIVTSLIPPRILPKLDFSKGIPETCRTLVAVPTLLQDLDEVRDLLQRIEVHYLANPDGDIRFALLSDWPDAHVRLLPGDGELLQSAMEGMEELNARYGAMPDGGSRFLLLHRERRWNAREGVWMGWERKRGKLQELNRLLRGDKDVSFMLQGSHGPISVPHGVRYVITLDTDTRLPKGAAARLAGCMAHPLNRARFDAAAGKVVSGYGILQPRVVPSLPEIRERTFFHRVTSGPCGIDPYAAAVSDVYQDLFDEGSFTGKGIYDVDAFEASLRDRIPENTLLSHDLFEGNFARAGLLTDVEVLEDFPSHYQVHAARQHRWARGDWQLLPWILGRGGKGLPFLGRWKMIDNLRRCLVAPCAFLALALAWILAAHPPVAWTALVLVALLLPYLIAAAETITEPSADVSFRHYLRDMAGGLLQALSHYVLTVVLLAHQAWLLSDAAVRTLLRLTVTHKRLLEWTTAAQSATRLRKSLSGSYRGMAAAVALPAALVYLCLLFRHPANLALAAPLLVLWAASPSLALIASTPRRIRPWENLTAGETRRLRRTALKTWRFFRAFVGPGDNYLPPDNFQEDPKPVLAHRTSPTNMGLCLLSISTARDLGWLALGECAQRLEAVLGSMRKLERYKGHFFNWYETRDLRVLEPRYVSTVDSGNLAGHLLVLKRICHEYMDADILHASQLEGLADLVDLVKEAAVDLPSNLRVQAFGRAHMLEAVEALESSLSPAPADLGDWAVRMPIWLARADAVVDVARSLVLEQKDDAFAELLSRAEFLHASLDGMVRDMLVFFPWAAAAAALEGQGGLPAAEAARLLHGRISLRDLEASGTAMALALRAPARTAQAAGPEAGGRSPDSSAPVASARSAESDALANALIKASGEARKLLDRLGTLAATAERTALEMDFSFLEDPQRKLFAIGFRVREEKLDASFYDLLASEVRLTSFLAVAKGDVPPSHWFRLGRTLTPVGKGATLLSWSGSMFEYLMPVLVMRSPPGSLLESACRYAVQRQIEYGNDNGTPWGISEAAYNIRDIEMTYQYSSFGVPGLGLKRGLSGDLVIAPYATGLAAMVAPREAAENLDRLRAEGAEGAYGFYEAIDFTKVRLQEGDRATVVKSYFAHHQGMMLVALGNVLQGGRMQERFHAEPIIRAVDPLLQERMPRGVAVTRPNADEVDRPLHVETLLEPVLHRFNTPHETIPRTHILSNGRYTVLLSAAGSGFSRWQNLAVTRWREDAVLDSYGQYFYLRDVDSGETWSAGYQPLCVEADDYEATFAEDRVEITRRDGMISTTLEIVISPEDDAEVRRVTLENLGDRDREIEITSYCEVVMAPHEADVAHPAFSNLFVQTEFIPGMGALLATRRARASTETHSWAAHVSGVEGGTVGVIQYETDRARFLGRGRTVRRPVSVVDGKPLSNTTGAVLDPVFSLRRRVKVPGNGRIRITFATLAAQTREQALALSDKYREPESFERVATLAWTQAQIQLRHLGIGPDEARMYQRLANRLFFPDPALRPSPDLQALNRKGQDALWAYGISGDLPIIFAAFDEAGDRNLARDLLKAHSYWEMKRLDVDLILVNENPSESYQQPQQDELEGLLRMRRTDQATRGGVFLLRKDRIPSEDRVLMLATARAVLVGRRGSLADQTMRMRRATVHVAPPASRRETIQDRHVPPLRPQLEFFNGLGGFVADGKEYHIILGEGQWTPAPWVNVIANPNFGFIASEAGSGFTWAGNSRERKLTPWSNDPVGDPPGEAAYIRDRDTGSVWTPTALPIRQEGRPYVAVHGQGYTRYLHSSHGIRLELLQWVPWDDPVKLSRLTIENLSSHTRHLDVTFYAEWVLGPARGPATQHVQTFVDRGTGALFARNSWVAEFAGQVAFADLEGRQDSYTCDRSEFLGRNGDRARPSALARSGALSNRSGAGLDPCAALQSILELPPGGRVQLVFTLGQAADEPSATALVKKYRGADFEASWREVQKRWDGLLGRVQIKTPDRSLDLLLNRWLPYQILTCRLWARSGFYQAGGAFGFRDQLQDVMALAVLDPSLAREQILRASARQFPPGDVQHWWHPPSGRGVRTRFTDDRVWLPYAVLHYLDVTGDAALLEERTTWLEGPEVPEGREDSYFQPKTSAETATVYEHCARALDRSLELGAHGLPLFGSGDWNDGMNRVGHEGKGESGWLAWFLIPNLKAFAVLAEARGDAARARLWRDRAEHIRESMESRAWDGDWYRRGYFDDGTPLGSSGSQECRIDSLAQTWAVLSGAGDPARARQAMFSVEEYLVRRADGLILLFTPPFDKSASDPGYIKGYLPGVRENGGQYTHASAWVVAAFAALGEGDKAAEFFSLLNPVNHASTRAGVYRYKVEPYAAAADVYAVSPHVGRGGWTWYTGSAGWLYRTGLEWMLGLRLVNGRLVLKPCIPREWSGFEISYRRGTATYEISVLNPNGYTAGIASLDIDGVRQPGAPDTLELSDDGKTHRIKVTLGPPRIVSA